MGAPVWLTATFAALMLTVVTYCAGRLAVAHRWQRPTELDTDAGHVLMGLAMAGLLVSRLRLLPAAAPPGPPGAVCTQPPTWSNAPPCSTCCSPPPPSPPGPPSPA